MSGKTVEPEALVEEQTTTEEPTGSETDPSPEDDGFPFESAEFGVGGFLPHLDEQADG